VAHIWSMDCCRKLNAIRPPIFTKRPLPADAGPWNKGIGRPLTGPQGCAPCFAWRSSPSVPARKQTWRWSRVTTPNESIGGGWPGSRGLVPATINNASRAGTDGEGIMGCVVVAHHWVNGQKSLVKMRIILAPQVAHHWRPSYVFPNTSRTQVGSANRK
jgi:hypothetical protein